MPDELIQGECSIFAILAAVIASLTPRRLSFVVLGLGLVIVAFRDLGHCLLAGLFAYLILEQTERLLRETGAKPITARVAAVLLFLIVAALLSLILASFLRIAMVRLPVLLDRLLPRLEELSRRFGIILPVDNARELHTFVMEAAREHVRGITATSGVLTRGFFQILMAVGAALARFLSPGPRTTLDQQLHHAIARECRERTARFWQSFTLVASAQVLSAAVNAGVTAVFLFAAHVPFRTFLTLAAFIGGMIPVAGSAASAVLIVATAFTQSTELAVAALIFVLVWHKIQYFVHSRIVGAHIDMPLWSILIGLLAGEALMGIAGLMLAPTVLHYVREELRKAPVGSV